MTTEAKEEKEKFHAELDLLQKTLGNDRKLFDLLSSWLESNAGRFSNLAGVQEDIYDAATALRMAAGTSESDEEFPFLNE